MQKDGVIDLIQLPDLKTWKVCKSLNVTTLYYLQSK